MPAATTPFGYPYPLATDLVSQGDDNLHNLASKVESARGVMAKGAVTINVAAINTTYSSAVTFPVGRFTVEPSVLLQPQTGVPQSVFGSLQQQPTLTGVTLCVRRSSGTGNLTVHWLAAQPGA